MKRMTSLVGKGFQPAKCKTQLRLGSSRIKLLRNKKGIQIASDRREVADFLRNGQEGNARLRVEHVIREQNLIEAYDLLYLYAERIAAQLSVIDSKKTCPPELKEDISTLLYASARCAELPDFAQIRPMFVAKYGKEFVSAAEELRPGCGVNGRVIEKLSVSRASGEAKLQVMKDIAAEHDVHWDPAPFEKEIRTVPNDLLDGPTKIMSAEDIDDLPTVPSQKPILGTHLAQPDNFTNSNSGRFMEDKVEPKSSPRPVDDFRTSSQGARSGPPNRKPPAREQSRTEDLSFDDRHTDMDPGGGEIQPRRSSRRESDSFAALSSLAKHQDEESRRNSIGVPREKSGRPHTGSAFGGIDEFSPHDYAKHIRRGSQGAELDDFDGSHKSDRRQSQKYDQFDSKGQVREANSEPSAYTKNSRPARTPREELNHTSDEDDQGGFAKPRPRSDNGRRNQTRREEDPEEVNYRKEGSGRSKPRKQDLDADEDYYKRVPSREGSGKGRGQYQAQESDEHDLRKAPSREGSGKGRVQYQDQESDEHDLRKAPSREGSGKGRVQYQDQESDEHDLRKAPSREGSGKGRTHHDDQYVEEQNLRRASSKEGSGGKAFSRETSVEEGSHGRVNGRSKEGSQHAGKYRRDDYSDEDADPIPYRSEEPRRRDSTKYTPKYADEDVHNPESESESFKNSITTRKPRNSEDEYRDSGNGPRRESRNRRGGVSSQEDYSTHLSEGDDDARKKKGSYLNDTSTKRSNLAVKNKDKERSIPDTPHYDSSEYEDDPRRGGPRNPEPRRNNSNGTNTRNSDRSSESGEEGSRQSTRRTPRLPSVDEQRRDTLDDQGSSRGKRYGREDLEPLKTPRDPVFDNDKDHLTTSSRTEKRMSLPGGNVRDKPKNQGRASDDYDDAVRVSGRRATIGPEEINRGARVRESDDPPRSRYGEKEKQSDRRLSAPLSKDDIMEGRQSPKYPSQSDRSDRRRLSDIPAGYDDDKPSRFGNPKVAVQASRDDEYSPNARAQRDRSDRPRKSDISLRYDDDKPPPRFINVGKQTTLDDDLRSGRSSPGFKGEKPQRFVNSPRGDEPLQATPRPRSNLQSVKTDPTLPKTPKASATEHRKSQSVSDGQPQSKPTPFMKPPDLDVLIQMFGKKK
ncbi:hypothetical protein KC19_2G204900 [Ceratodon purpureus]|uniref:Regulator of Vps4 activity in the MVB pathway protein n=1 Tax=Ceratodon purpureus TaxID=3225 RepID=A0A8T0IZ82_CERPU|nr:hypothetical protein KC19_2G204900 [Ceratodon purpureus]